MINPHRTAARLGRRLLVLGLAIALLAPAARPTNAALAPSLFAISNGNALLRFKAAAPGTIEATVLISGLQVNETLVAIDFRPANGQLYGLGIVNALGDDTGRLYQINTVTGAATIVGPGPFSTSLADGANYGFDFNPAVDRIRVVSSADQNFRLNPDTGTISGIDTSLDNPAGGEEVFSSAYDRNFPGTTQTTLYAIDLATNQLMTQGGINGAPSPNGGSLTAVGPLGIALGSQLGGFDIGRDGVAYASLQPSGGLFGLYQINLATGAATLVGPIGNGAVPIAGLAVGLPRFVYLPRIIK
jgi:hypothetical protein